MTLTDLASIGSFVSGIAVVVSLIYLALQVRLARKVQQAFMHQARVERITSASLGFLQPDIAALIAKGSTQPETLSAQEVIQLVYFLRIQITAHEDAIWQTKAGFLDQQALDITELTSRRMMANPVLRATWRLVRPQCPPEVQAHFDQFAADTPLMPPVDWARAWKDAYVAVKAQPNPAPANAT